MSDKNTDEGENQVNKLKKTAAGVVLLVILLQVAVLSAVADNANVVSRLHEQGTILIDLFKDDETNSDFVNQFPDTLYSNEPQTVNIAKPAEKKVYDKIPRYEQEDFDHALYGQGTVATHGSSMTALAMMATYLSGYEYLPDEVAYNFAAKAKTDEERVLLAAHTMGLGGTRYDAWDNIWVALQEGKCAILQLTENSVFTEGWHFIVLESITPEGKIMVNDPCGANYEKTELQEGYTNGFDPALISRSFASGVVFDKTIISPGLQKYEEPIGAEERYKSLELTYAEKQLLARAVYVLKDGECAAGQQMFVETLLNRMLSEDYSDDLTELVYGNNGLCKLEDLNNAEVSAKEYKVVERAICGPYTLEKKSKTKFSNTCHE